jgi:hypothetical protein
MGRRGSIDLLETKKGKQMGFLESLIEMAFREEAIPNKKCPPGSADILIAGEEPQEEEFHETLQSIEHHLGKKW